MIPGARLVRRLVIVVAILLALAAGADRIGANIAEDRVAKAAQTEFDLPAAPRVSLGGFPVVLNVLRGRLPLVTVSADDVTVGSLTLAHVEVRLEDIRADGLLGGDATVTVGTGSVRADVEEAELNRFLDEAGKDATVEIHEGGQATVRATRTIALRKREIVATGPLTITKGTFVFVPKEVTMDGKPPPSGFRDEARRQSTVRVRLPELPGGVTVSRVETTQGRATFVSELDGRTLSLA